VATFETTLVIPRPLEATFAFVTDFRNAPTWDPRTYDAQKTTEGPIGLGTRFLLRGGLISKQTLERLHVPDVLRQASELAYEVVSFVPRQEMIVRGETPTLRYEDHLVFSADGDGTKLRYAAKLELKGVLELGEPILKPIFDAIGEDATRGIPAAVEVAVPRAGAAAPWLPASPIVSPDDVRRVVAIDDQIYLRNLLITQGYHDLSQQILARTGGVDMNWCTLGTWASRTAGTFIRDEEIPAVLRKVIEGKGPLQLAFHDLQVRLDPGNEAKPPRLIELARAILHDCATYIMMGNKVVFAELAGCCADFVQTLGGDRSPDPEKLAAFQARYRDGDPQPDAVEWGPDRTLIPHPRGGQAMLRGMVGQLYQAMFETDPKQRAEHILFANAYGGLHEQTRLQTYIVGGIDAPIDDTLVAWAHKHVDRSTPEVGRGPLHAAVDGVLPAIGRLIKDAWQDFSTGVLMTLTLPDGVLHLGYPIPQEPGVPVFPPALETISDPELAAVLDRYGALDVQTEPSRLAWLRDRIRSMFGAPTRGAVELADVGTPNWTDFDERMRYILTLFRMRQQDTHLFQQPFSDTQRAMIFEGQLPPGPL
jgi:hypothetical protein